jgi:hypothetical protein
MKQYKLFEVTGIELEYMVVDRDTLKVLPIVDKLFEDVTGKPSPAMWNAATWSGATSW